MITDGDTDADRVIDVDREKISADEALFWKVCVFCEAHLGPEYKENANE
jgi:hypothetical protein